ncbi:MAG: 4-hydroxy-3-methylbut-2-enyl diphosphate reductase [Candidatus Omnitrophica bacterium]|nr:4-hydroxy-3-methylbut-2-enyl diphosphate reductase [Candidatus Omnitrophota bacterium]
MKIKLSKYCDFCFGVKRAVRLIEEALDKRKEPLYSLGPFIHNPRVVEQFSKKGLKTASSLRDIKRGTLVIRSHGISPDVVKKVKASGIKLLDVTCPNVKKSQKVAGELARRDYKVIIVGDKAHPEVKSLVGAAGGRAFVVNRPQALKKLKLNAAKAGVIVQTTQSKSSYLKILTRLLEKNFSEIKIYNTICEDTLCRQEEASEIARNVEIMLVLGGKMSANSRRLAEICRAHGAPTYHIESGSQIKAGWLRGKTCVGIAGGASTPKWIVDEVINQIKQKNNTRKR